jgi:hypothetical protein
MNTIEDKLWNYIDGSLSADEQRAVALLIEHDSEYLEKYRELVHLNDDFKAMELNEPSMAFTYNVMHSIREDYAIQPLKSSIDKRVIWGVALFFILTIATLLIYSISAVNWAVADSVKVLPHINIFKVSGLFNGYVVKAFLFFDLVMGLFLTDYYLRRKTLTKHH